MGIPRIITLFMGVIDLLTTFLTPQVGLEVRV